MGLFSWLMQLLCFWFSFFLVNACVCASLFVVGFCERTGLFLSSDLIWYFQGIIFQEKLVLGMSRWRIQSSALTCGAFATRSKKMGKVKVSRSHPLPLSMLWMIQSLTGRSCEPSVSLVLCLFICQTVFSSNVLYSGGWIISIPDNGHACFWPFWNK